LIYCYAVCLYFGYRLVESGLENCATWRINSMTVAQIEQRVAALEVEVTRLKEKLEAVTKPARPWWQEIYGTFADDPLHEEAMQAGREYRESLRPKAPERQSRPSKRKK
jgi:hypothetical protein